MIFFSHLAVKVEVANGSTRQKHFDIRETKSTPYFTR